MLKLSLALAVPALLAALHGSTAAHDIASPDNQVKVQFDLSPRGEPRYAVERAGKAVLLDSRLGLRLQSADLTRGLRLAAAGAPQRIVEEYTLATGKRRQNRYEANERRFALRDKQGRKLDIVFRVSNDGVAFRYETAGGLVRSEATSFAFPSTARAWLQPMSVAQTGWANTNPSYEEYYHADIAVGTPSPLKTGWVFPALFRNGDNWVALTEAGMDGSWHASRLQAKSPGGEYRIGSPTTPEAFPGGALMGSGARSPWRVLAVGPLATVVQSSLGTDLAEPAIAFDAALVQPGHASWSWAILKDDATVFDVQKKFIDYAAQMKWDYTLVDADWDRKIGYERTRELAQYAAGKGVGLLVWYNSSGAWNKTEYSPKGKLLTREARRAEFARLRAMGVKGVKIDFFGGDGQSMIAYYVDMLKDAAEAGLLVNFHGATLPRGWSRTYPNLMTVEAVRGFEFATFEQGWQDKVAAHAAMLPFARNLFDPMDFTPMAFGDIPKIKRATRNGFELAEAVLFTSGIQHFAEIPEGMATAPSYVQDLLRDLPRSWDDMRFVDGVPARYAVLARRAGDTWYVAGFNAQDSAQEVSVELGAGTLVTDGAGEREFSQRQVAAGRQKITMQPRGGFVAVFKQ
jgi:hypothetical protein